MPRNPEKVRLDDHAVRPPRQFQAHALVDDATVASKERQRLAHISRGGYDVKQETSLARVRLLGEMKPERRVIQGLGGGFEKLALSRSGHATPRIVQFELSETGAMQQRPFRYVAFLQSRNRALDRKPRHGRQRLPRHAYGHAGLPWLNFD